jgi:hypothetical protein
VPAGTKLPASPITAAFGISKAKLTTRRDPTPVDACGTSRGAFGKTESNQSTAGYLCRKSDVCQFLLRAFSGFFHLPTPIVRCLTMASKQKSKKQSNPSLLARAFCSVSIPVHISTTLSLRHESLVMDTLLAWVT